MALLGVNIDHVATLRNARDASYPDPLALAHQALSGGADFITFHLREDRRHINEHDCASLIGALPCRTNLELAIDEEIVALATTLKPSDCCLVPEKRNERTTEGGMDLASASKRIADTRQQLEQAGIATSIFINPEPQNIDQAIKLGFKIIELHSGAYAAQQENDAYAQLVDAIAYAAQCHLRVNVGHGLTAPLLEPLAGNSNIAEFNIGHAIVCDALHDGMKQTVARYKKILNDSK